jgi:hypothetical protein
MADISPKMAKYHTLAAMAEAEWRGGNEQRKFIPSARQVYVSSAKPTKPQD